MTSRRSLLLSAAAAPVLARPAAKTASPVIPEFEAKIARRDFRGLTREDLGTPAMILDIDLFEKNLKTMADHCKASGISLRGHVKIHKSPEIARRQLALGSIGVCCATIAECELMVNSGIKGALFTCQPSGRNKIQRVAALARRDNTFIAVADDPVIVDQLDEAAAAARTKINVLTDVFAGLERQGCDPKNALALAQKMSKAKNLNFLGLMAYSGWASHTKGFEPRRKRSADDLAGMLEAAGQARKSGLNVQIKTGGSTGTYNIDVGSLTELQAGSFVFMDTSYMYIGGKSHERNYADFAPSLTVLTTVVSKTRGGMCSIDAGNKAMLRESDEVKGRGDVKIKNQGAEYGLLVWKDGDRDYKVGDKVEIYPTNLDTSTNVYDRYYIARGEQIVDVWPIMGRAGAAQR